MPSIDLLDIKIISIASKSFSPLTVPSSMLQSAQIMIKKNEKMENICLQPLDKQIFL